MSAAELVLDGALAGSLPLLAWRVVVADELPEAVVLFIASGLLTALAWARLDAPDIALVEAAVGAGLTGALLMTSLGRSGAGHESSRRPSAPRRALLWLLLAALALCLGAAVLGLPPAAPGLRDAVAGPLPVSGISHPVTAVLLDFRGYDTLLEVTVLLVAVRAAGAAAGARGTHRRGEPVSPLLAPLVRLLVPGIVLVAGFLVWRGSAAPGGAFQAGALLGGGGVLLVLARIVEPPSLSSRSLLALLLAGPALFVAIGWGGLLSGGELLEYPARGARELILALESLLALSIGLVLTLFFAGVARGGLPGRGDAA